MVAQTTPPAASGEPPDEITAPSVPQPATIEQTGLELSMLADLMLKTIHFSGRPSGRQLAQQSGLSFGVTEEIIGFLRQEQAIEIVGSASAGVGEQAYQYALTDRGRHKTEEAQARSQYVGPAPVPFQLYANVLKEQSAASIRFDREALSRSLSHMVLSRKVLASLGPAFNSGRSVLVYGASGNGKTSITMALGRTLPGQVMIPYAVEVHGQIIRVFDSRLHEVIPPRAPSDRRREDAQPPAGAERRRDRRWVLARRPLVSVGGELTLDDLELRYSAHSGFYIAPLQWKANSGMLIIDDFGRQMIQPQELLNRWIVPMEQGIDHLTLHTGDTVELPFDMLLVFSSNIPPGELGDEAFFRRIRHKVEIPNPTPEEFVEILRRVTHEHNVPYSDEGVRYLLSVQYERAGRQLKSCHPRDIIDLLLDIATFFGEPPSLRPELLDLACASYFIEAPAPGSHFRRAA